MKKIMSILLLAILLVLPMSLAVSQGEANKKVDNVVKTATDYKNLIDMEGNKLEYLMDLLDLNSISSTFRALYRSSGYKSYLRMRSGIRYAKTSRGRVDMYDDAPIVEAICGNGIVEGGDEECDDGNLINGDNCSDVCEWE